MARGKVAPRVGEDVLGEPKLSDPEWHRVLGPVLHSRRIQQLLSIPTHSEVVDLVERRHLLGLPAQAGELAFPTFQFTAAGQPYAVLPAVLNCFSGAVASPYTIASWFVTPQPLLRGETPAQWLRLGRDDEPVKEAARRSATRLGQ